MMYERQFEAGVPFGPATERAKEIILETDKTLLREIEAMINVGRHKRRIVRIGPADSSPLFPST